MTRSLLLILAFVRLAFCGTSDSLPVFKFTMCDNACFSPVVSWRVPEKTTALYEKVMREQHGKLVCLEGDLWVIVFPERLPKREK
jgi:hypothetical protein